MKKTNRIIAMLCALMLTFTLMAGCGSKQTSEGAGASGSAGGQTSVQWWTPNWKETEAREIAAEFEAENPDIKIDITITDWESYKSKITTAISGKNAPEIFVILLTDVAPLAKQGLLTPLDELGASAGIDLDGILDKARDITTVDGKLYQIPYQYDGSGIFYNAEMLEAAGYSEFPKTWDDMIEMSKKLSTDGRYGFAWPLANQANAVTRLVQQLYTYGGDVLNEDETECVLNSAAAKKALGNIVNSIHDGYASPSSSEYDTTKMRDAFATGGLAFNFTGPFDIGALKDDYPDFNFKTAVIPGDGGMGCTTANGWGISMAENCNNKEAAAKFLAYVTTPDNQARMTLSFPANKTAIAYEQFASEELKPFAAQLDNSKPEPTYTRWAEIEPIIYSYMQSAVSKSMSVDEACEAMAKDITALLAS